MLAEAELKCTTVAVYIHKTTTSLGSCWQMQNTAVAFNIDKNIICAFMVDITNTLPVLDGNVEDNYWCLLH